MLLDINNFKQIEQENIQLKRQLQQSQKMEAIGVLSGGIAHDFNNILHPIIGNLEILIEDSNKDKQLQNNLKNILNGANRARRLVKQILRFSFQKDHKIKPVKMQDIIKEVLKLGSSSLPTTIKIVEAIDNECGPVMADPTNIYQIAINLITNAASAMEQNGGILGVTLNEVKVNKKNYLELGLSSGTYVCLSIADTGIGMDSATGKKIFAPYLQQKK